LRLLSLACHHGADRPPSGPGWVHEIKFDGFRMLARRDGAGVRLLTRNGIDWAGRYPGIMSAVNRLRLPLVPD
jgi:bifunctional non-homologous end joining protein LigD